MRKMGRNNHEWTHFHLEKNTHLSIATVLVLLCPHVAKTASNRESSCLARILFSVKDLQ